MFSALHHPARLRQGARVRVWMCWLALLVVLAPTLNRVHSVLHLPAQIGQQQAFSEYHHQHQQGDHAAVLLDAPAAQGAQETQTAPSWLEALFQHHGLLDCWALEQLGHGHEQPAYFWPGLVSWPQAVSAWPPHAVLATAPLRWFEARAPPGRCMSV